MIIFPLSPPPTEWGSDIAPVTLSINKNQQDSERTEKNEKVENERKKKALREEWDKQELLVALCPCEG